MTDDQIAAIAEAVKLREGHEIGRTHWDGCEVNRSHRDCAIRLLLAALAAATQEIERLQAERDECSPYLKEGEAPAQCIARNRNDATMVLDLLVKATQRAESAESQRDALRAALEEIALFTSSELGPVGHAVCEMAQAALATEGQ